MPRHIVHNGVVMIEGWPERMEEAQQIFEYEIGGVLYPRVPYGAGENDLNADRLPCHDGCVTLGHLHVPMRRRTVPGERRTGDRMRV